MKSNLKGSLRVFWMRFKILIGLVKNPLAKTLTKGQHYLIETRFSIGMCPEAYVYLGYQYMLFPNTELGMWQHVFKSDSFSRKLTTLNVLQGIVKGDIRNLDGSNIIIKDNVVLPKKPNLKGPEGTNADGLLYVQEEYLILFANSTTVLAKYLGIVYGFHCFDAAPEEPFWLQDSRLPEYIDQKVISNRDGSPIRKR